MLVLEDAFTGLQVRGVGGPLTRARAGFKMSALRSMRYYNPGNPESSIVNQVLATIRINDSANCLDKDAPNAYNILVKGFARIDRAVGTCD